MLLEYMPQTGVPSIVNVDYSLMAPDTSILEEYCELNLGPRIITSDPCFVDPDSGDYQLNFNSPCIDNGTAEGLHSSKDFFGHERLIGETVDIGAHEYQVPFEKGLNLFMFDVDLVQGDSFRVDVISVGDSWNQVHHLVLCLEVAGVFYFYPHWTEDFNFIDVDVEYGRKHEPIADFIWPVIDGYSTDLRFWGAAVDSLTGDLIGDIACVNWHYH